MEKLTQKIQLDVYALNYFYDVARRYDENNPFVKIFKGNYLEKVKLHYGNGNDKSEGLNITVYPIDKNNASRIYFMTNDGQITSKNELTTIDENYLLELEHRANIAFLN